jgi:hypothetical protein
MPYTGDRPFLILPEVSEVASPGWGGGKLGEVAEPLGVRAGNREPCVENDNSVRLPSGCSDRADFDSRQLGVDEEAERIL